MDLHGKSDWSVRRSVCSVSCLSLQPHVCLPSSCIILSVCQLSASLSGNLRQFSQYVSSTYAVTCDVSAKVLRQIAAFNLQESVTKRCRLKARNYFFMASIFHALTRYLICSTTPSLTHPPLTPTHPQSLTHSNSPSTHSRTRLAFPLLHESRIHSLSHAHTLTHSRTSA